MSKVAQQSVPSYLSGVLTVACGKRCLRRRPSTPTVEVEADGVCVCVCGQYTLALLHSCTFCRPCFPVLISVQYLFSSVYTSCHSLVCTSDDSSNVFTLAQAVPENVHTRAHAVTHALSISR